MQLSKDLNLTHSNWVVKQLPCKNNDIIYSLSYRELIACMARNRLMLLNKETFRDPFRGSNIEQWNLIIFDLVEHQLGIKCIASDMFSNKLYYIRNCHGENNCQWTKIFWQFLQHFFPFRCSLRTQVAWVTIVIALIQWNSRLNTEYFSRYD